MMQIYHTGYTSGVADALYVVVKVGELLAFHRGRRLGTLSESRDAGNSHVRFDERDLETERHDRHRARSRLYVCREKPRISSGRDNKAHPGTNAPPGTTWRVDGGNKIDQAPQEKVRRGGSGSVQAVTRVNVEQASKRAMRTPSPLRLGEGWHPEGKPWSRDTGHNERNKPKGSPPE